MTLEKHDLALMTARFGACRFGATRFGFIPCPEDVVGPPDVDPGLYVWREQTPESQIVDTVWALQNEDCTCRDLCTLVIATMSVSPSPALRDVVATITIPLGGVLGLVSGVIRLHWGDGQHDEYVVETLESGSLQYPHTYDVDGDYTISVDITDERGCRAEKALAVTVAAGTTVSGLISFIADGQPICPGTTVHLINDTTPADVTTVTDGSGNYLFVDPVGFVQDDEWHIRIETEAAPCLGGDIPANSTPTQAWNVNTAMVQNLDIPGL